MQFLITAVTRHNQSPLLVRQRLLRVRPDGAEDETDP